MFLLQHPGLYATLPSDRTHSTIWLYTLYKEYFCSFIAGA